MKRFCAFFAISFMALQAASQLKTTTICPPLVVDILDGKVNDLFPNSTLGEVKAKLPCFTSVQEAGSSCGVSVFYKDKDIYFYVARNYIEIRDKFRGRLSIPLMGANRNGLFKWLGLPKIKDVNWDAYQTAYGILILYFTKAGKVNKIQFSTKTTDSINLCE